MVRLLMHTLHDNLLNRVKRFGPMREYSLGHPAFAVALLTPTYASRAAVASVVCGTSGYGNSFTRGTDHPSSPTTRQCVRSSWRGSSTPQL